MTHEKQHILRLLAAMSAPLALCAGCGWGTVLLASVILLTLTCLPGRWEGMGRGMRWIQAVWMGVVLGILIKESAAFWPSREGKPAPLILLALAFCTRNAAAVGAVLSFSLAALYAPVAVAGAAQVKLQWMGPAFGELTQILPVVLLLPSLLKGEKALRGAFGTGVLAVALALLTQGILSPWVAGSVKTPFYEMARTLGHLEPVVAVAVTLGFYTLAAGILERSGGKWERILTAFTAAGAVLLEKEISGLWMMIPSVILWVIVPFVRYKSFFKKSEKRC